MDAAESIPQLIETDSFAYRRLPAIGRGVMSTVVALHGSGADETTMLPLARSIAPTWQVIAPRGRVDQHGERRWFTKLSPISFDQASICSEAAAFADFLRRLADQGTIDPARTLFLGYSNGGNLVSSLMLLHPGIVGRAALLRTMPVLLPAPRTNLSGTRAIVMAGKDDATYRPHAGRLVGLLRRRGAKVSKRLIDAGHMPVEADCEAIRNWLDGTQQRNA